MIVAAVLAAWMPALAWAGEDAWLRPRLSAEQLGQVDAIVGDARIVGLGEHIHTAGGLYEVKVQLIEHLVRDLGFRVVAFETPRLEFEPAGRFVAGEDVDELDAIASVFGVFDDVATLRLLRFLRGWNAEHASDPVSLVGFDVQDGQAAFAERLGLSGDALSVCAAGSGCDGFDATACGEALDGAQLGDELDARLTARALRFQVDQCAADDDDEYLVLRDAAMADVLTAQLRGPLSGRAVVWAHNTHLALVPIPSHAGPMGSHLRRTWGEDYVVLAMSATRTDLGWVWAPYGAQPKDLVRMAYAREGDLVVDALDDRADHRRRYFVDDVVVRAGTWDGVVNLAESRPSLQMRTFGALYTSAPVDDLDPRRRVAGMTHCFPRRQLAWSEDEQIEALFRYALDELGLRETVAVTLEEVRATKGGEWLCGRFGARDQAESE